MKAREHSIFKNRFFIGKNQALLLMILQKMTDPNKGLHFLKKSALKVCRFRLLCLKLAPSSFCVYLFGLESLAAIGRGISFFRPFCRL